MPSVRLMEAVLYTPSSATSGCAGCYHQFLPQPIQPIRETDKVVGRRCRRSSWTCTARRATLRQVTESLDQLQSAKLHYGRGTMRCAYWGESSRPRPGRAGVGAVIDGFHRDTPRVLEQNWPCSAAGGSRRLVGANGRGRLPLPDGDRRRVDRAGRSGVRRLDGVVIVRAGTRTSDRKGPREGPR